MTAVKCGTGIRYGDFPLGASGCLIAFRDSPERVMILTAGHVVLPSAAQQNDPVFSASGQQLGVLRGWTGFGGPTTTDAAVIWVDPALVSPEIVGLGAPTGVNLSPQVGDVVRLYPRPDGAPVRTGKISRKGVPIDINLHGPDWAQPLTYQDQIMVSPQISQGGDSGAVVLDVQGRVVGMVVAGSAATDETVVTPIGAILDHPDFKGRMDVLGQIPAGAISPAAALAQAKLEAPLPKAITASGFGALVPGGFFSDDPNDLKVPRSIRSNNPGALNYSNWQASRPGYVGKTQPDGSADHNVTTIYRTPEHGAASWFHLLSAIYGFGAAGSFTLKALAAHYAGQASGSAVDAYVKGWTAASKGGLTAASSIDAGDDAQMLVLGKAMFAHEAGRPSPVHDDQILYAIAHERKGDMPG